MGKFINYNIDLKSNLLGRIYKTTDFERLDIDNLKNELEKKNISISGQPINGFSDRAWSYVLYLKTGCKEKIDIIPCEEKTSKIKVETGLNLANSGENETDILKWLEYSKILEELVKFYTNREVLEIIMDEIESRVDNIRRKILSYQKISEIEKLILTWYYEIIVNKTYYKPEEAQKIMILK